MKKYILLLAMVAGMLATASAQTYVTRNGQISFYSKTSLEDIKATNKQVFAAIDLSKKTVAFSLLMRGFLFDKQLMQDHFNENYVESDKFPKATFNGSFTGAVENKPGKYPVQIEGKLTLHGVTQPVTIPAVLEVQSGSLSGTASFSVKPADYKIEIPSVVKDKIAQQITVQVSIAGTPLK
ncbi:polyisoprenoid-binding protein YceI [Filimonas zeae]|uniref:Lipid/polyisoprenoid-binding YceI-like domain-containing protein n=1 Tax=Filimonas zeae TaxID=1737353 RepID=A0A917J495_9BACT|nr:YceI family protein [Filimonas zeae]MDR6341995.1 polyisoprenoid-binding protein YceI [Filimonas zeae]GGH79528.1 hypothetical protein GCM10011379_49030 [Filimonas zeae]